MGPPTSVASSAHAPRPRSGRLRVNMTEAAGSLTEGAAAFGFLAGGGEMGRRMRAHDWRASPLGSPEGWPQSLKTIVRVILDSRYAMWMAWGPELTFFCNDAYLPTVGLKRDWVLGARSEEVWKEIWPDIGPRIEHVLASGQATWDEGLLLFLERSGFPEETYHTFSCSPLYDDQIRVAGMLCVVTEVTERVIGERRLRVLRDLAAHSVGVESVDDSCQRAIQVLAQYPNDLPFAALYLIGENGIGLKDGSPEGAHARRAALSRQLPESWFPAILDLSDGENPWQPGELLGDGPGRNIVSLAQRGLRIGAGLWPDPVQQAVVLPIKSAGQDRLVGFLVAGVSPRRAFDDAYGSFLELLARQVSSAIANAKAYEIERGLRREASAREQALRVEAEALINEAPLGIYVVGADFRVRDVNPAARVAFRSFPDPIGQDFDAVMHTMRPREYADEVVRAFRHTLQTGETYVRSERIEELSGRGPDQHYEWQVSRIPLPGGVHGVVCYFRNVSAHVQARTALENADRQKNEFLAMLAHELRNPLAPIRNAGEILSRTLPPNSPTHAAIAMVKRQVTQLTRLVDDLLDVSRITQGRVELKREPLDLASVISHAVEMVEPLFRERQHEVSIISSYRTLHIHGDMARLVQCVVNILTNAAKYTDAGGKINLQTRADEGYALVEVSDTGAGISPELLPRVFELFVQGDRTLDRSLGGLGIGLSVARQLIEMHGGRIAALSPGLGRGSTFKLWLPLIERPGELGDDAAQHQLLPKRVLIADDNVDAADSLAAVLQLDGHVTKTVYFARDVLEQAVAFAPDIILLDIGLPEMDGYEVARRVRAVKRLDPVRLVALTGYGQVEDLRRAREAGFDDHLVKPVDFDTLSRCLGGLPAGAFTRRVNAQ